MNEWQCIQVTYSFFYRVIRENELTPTLVEMEIYISNLYYTRPFITVGNTTVITTAGTEKFEEPLGS